MAQSTRDKAGLTNAHACAQACMFVCFNECKADLADGAEAALEVLEAPELPHLLVLLLAAHLGEPLALALFLPQGVP